MSSFPMSRLHPVLLRVGWPLESTPTTTVTLSEMLLPLTSADPLSLGQGLGEAGRRR